MNRSGPALPEVILKTVVVYSITYSVIGLRASTIFSYGRLFEESSFNIMMRSTSDLGRSSRSLEAVQ